MNSDKGVPRERCSIRGGGVFNQEEIKSLLLIKQPILVTSPEFNFDVNSTRESNQYSKCSSQTTV